MATQPLATPPPELANAIAQASTTYQVPPDLLTGIWREEAGGAFPNPYVNPSGYGGLFGTKDWAGPTQEQANLAASILHTGLVRAGGNVGEALSYYNSGQLSGGYTSVPGETTFGSVPVSGNVPGAPTVAGLPTPVSSAQQVGSGLGVVLRELFIRALEFIAGAALLYLGVRAFAAAAVSPAVTAVRLV